MRFDVSAAKDFTSIPELASEWGVSAAHIHNLIGRRELPAFRIGKRYIIRRSDAKSFLERNATARAAA
jgi:excisionase family DNA binding protein